jgi:uncharacterized protein with HEPN domain
MNPRANKHLHDMAGACRRILAFTIGTTWEAYQASDLLRSAVERQFQILGETAVRLRDDDPETFHHLPESHAIVGLRNRLAHGYDAIEDAILWSVVREKVPPLLRCLETLLAES